MRLLTASLVLFSVAFGQNLHQYCPNIECVLYDDYMEPNNLCMYHDRTLSTPTIKLRSCNDNPNQMCDLFSNFAWTEGAIVDQRLVNNQSVQTIDPRRSPLYGKRTEVSCVDKNDLLETNLQNGRRCLENYQCMSRNCEWSTGVCIGKFEN